jgi:vesicular inhibitory amino acid transporter
MPSLARDMQNPREFDSMINWAFVSKHLRFVEKFDSMHLQTAATAVYGIIGAAGYIMFGNRVSEEVRFILVRAVISFIFVSYAD